MDGSPPPWRVIDPETTPTEVRPLTRVPAWTAVLATVSIMSLACAAVVVLNLRGPFGGATQVPGFPEEGPTSTLVVEVAGAVVDPGVYRLPDGSRVADAVTAAGGYSPRVDAEAAERGVALAAPLSDGERIVVPSRDAPVAEGAPGGATGTPGTPRVDLNRATQAELESLPGIGPVTATRIIAAREERPFATAGELLERKVVGTATYEKISHLVEPGP